MQSSTLVLDSQVPQGATVAEAYLEYVDDSADGEVICTVGLHVCPKSPVDVARLVPGRRWGSPRLERGSFYFSYRSMADDIVSFAVKGSWRGLKLRPEAKRRVEFWLSDAVDAELELDEEEDADGEPAIDRPDPVTRVLDEVRAEPLCVFAAESRLHAHGDECMEHRIEEEFATAAEALDLPLWASVTSRSAGGPGTGFTEAIIVLKKGRTFHELVEWFMKRAAKAGAPMADKAN
jgi:hypothetical protein